MTLPKKPVFFLEESYKTLDFMSSFLNHTFLFFEFKCARSVIKKFGVGLSRKKNSETNMKKILILGSNSFAGASFIKHVKDKDNLKIFAVSRSKENNYYRLPYKWISKKNSVIFKKFDINRNYNELIKYINKIKPNYIVDFAAQGMVNQSWQNPEHWYYTNVYSKAKLHNYLSKTNYIEKYLKISTAEVYGNSSKKIIERAYYNPSTPYALSHATMDMNLMLLYDNFKFPVVFARPLKFLWSLVNKCSE